MTLRWLRSPMKQGGDREGCTYTNNVVSFLHKLGRYLFKLGYFFYPIWQPWRQIDAAIAWTLWVNSSSLLYILKKNSDKSIKCIDLIMLVSILSFGIITIDSQIDTPTPTPQLPLCSLAQPHISFLLFFANTEIHVSFNL